jgi:hypothetical protein
MTKMEAKSLSELVRMALIGGFLKGASSPPSEVPRTKNH